MAGKVIDRDRGMRELLRMAERIKREQPHVAVGITGKSGGKPHEGGGSMTIVDIGAVHEFGAGGVPERSFLRATIDKHAQKYRAHMTNGMRRGVLGAVRGQGGADVESPVLKRTGLMAEGDIKRRIAEGIAPALAPATIAAKGSSKPLIDTGQLRASIASEIRKGRGQ